MRFYLIATVLFSFISSALASPPSPKGVEGEAPRALPVEGATRAPENAPAVIPEVVVHGEKEEGGEGTAASQISIQVSNYKHRIVTVQEIISEQAGIHLKKYGGLEDATSISIRGSQSDEVLVTLDGIPLNSAAGDSVDLSPFLLSEIESIDIYRGATPLEAGFSSAAGLVALKSKKIGEGIHYGGSLGYGSFNSVRASADFARRGKRSGYLLQNSYSRTDGDFTFLDDNGTPANSADDETVKRQNNESQTVHPFFKFFYEPSATTRLEGLTHLIRRDKGVPGFSSNQSDEAALDETDLMTSLKLTRRRFFHDSLNFEGLTYFRWNKSQYSDLLGEIGLGGAQDNDDDTLLFGLKDSVMVAAGSHHLLTFFALYQFESFSPENFMASPSAGDTSRRHTVNTGAGDEIDLLDHRLLITPSFWFENIFNSLNNNDPSLLVPATFANTDSEHHFSASLGVKGKVTSFLDLIAHAARSFRNPTFPELFGDRGGIVGNPLLDPQESINWDVGFQFHPPLEKGGRGDFLNDLFISSLYFDRRVTNLIQFQQNSGFARAENVGKARIQGMEIQGGAEFLNHFGLYGNYTFQIAKDWANSGRTIPGQPKHELDTRLEGWWKKWKGTVSLNWMDSNFLDPLNTRVVRDRLLLNSALSFWPKDKIGVTVEAKNLADDQVVDVVGFPLPGRSFYAKADLRF